jgi:DNA-binding beta-propeller fold protein YncE
MVSYMAFKKCVFVLATFAALTFSLFISFSLYAQVAGSMPQGTLQGGPRAALIYVANRAGTTFDVIDTKTNKVVEVIRNIESPETARFSPDGSRVYLDSGSEDVLDVMDRKSGKVIKKVPLSGWPNDEAVTIDGKQVLICIRNTAQNTGALDIVDTTSLEKVKTIPMKRGLHDIALTPDGKYAAAGSPEGGFLTVVDLKSYQVAWEIQYDQGVQPLTIESNPDGSGRRIFIQLNKTHGFAVVDFAKHAEVARIKLPDEPGGFRKNGGSSHGIAIAPDGKSLWVNSSRANAVFVYSLPELQLLGHASMPELNLTERASSGTNPGWITFTPDSKTVYISLHSATFLDVIDATTLKEVTRIPVGEHNDRVSTLVLP